MKIIVLLLVLIVVSTGNSQQWKLLYDVDYNIYQLAVNSQNEIFIIAENFNQDTTSWLFMSNDNGKTWISKNIYHPYYYEDFFDNFRYYHKIRINSNDDIFIALDTIIIRSTDNGNSFQTILNDEILLNLFGYKTLWHWENNFDFAPNDDIYVSCFWRDSVPDITGYQIIKSTDNGDNWEIVAENTISFAELSFGRDGNVYMVKGWGAYCSKDTCKSWIPLSTDSIQKTNSHICSPLSLSMDNQDNIFILTEINSIIKSADYGKTWEIKYINYQAIMHGPHIEASNNGWVFAPKLYSLDNGVNWIEAPTDYDYLFAHDSSCYGIHRNGAIWKFSNDPVGVENMSGNFQIQISPNPAENILNISFSLGFPANIEIKLLDISGAELEIINNQHFHAGGYSFSWDCSRYPSGSYYILFRMNGEYEVRKVVVIK